MTLTEDAAETIKRALESARHDLTTIQGITASDAASSDPKTTWEMSHQKTLTDLDVSLEILAQGKSSLSVKERISLLDLKANILDYFDRIDVNEGDQQAEAKAEIRLQSLNNICELLGEPTDKLGLLPRRIDKAEAARNKEMFEKILNI